MLAHQLWLAPGDPADAGSGSRVRPKPGNGVHRPSTLLVVEDEVLIRMPVADYLRDCGFRVLEAANAGEAQALFEAGEPIEIVFSDIQMPGEINGFALAQWIRIRHPDVRVILTSGVASAAKHADEVCADSPFLSKPYSYEMLLGHIRTLLDPPG